MMPTSILAAMDDPLWWSTWFARGDWSAWKAFLAATFALPLADEALAIFQECTGRTEAPAAPARESWAICGRRGGKTRVLASVAAWLAIFVDHRPYLAPGEVGRVLLLASDRRQARVAMRYLRSLIVEHPKLAALVVREDSETIELANRIVIEVGTSSFRTIRGYTVVAVVCDELAFWFDRETSANPASEVLAALRPAMATIPNAMLLVATSPYAKRGSVWDVHRKHYGKDGDPILVWQAPTRTMNPAIPQSLIDDALELDPASAAAEYLAQFRSDIDNFISREIVDASVIPGRHELPASTEIRYAAFTDPSGGSSDSMTLAIAHATSDGRGVLDCIREAKPPFSPDSVVEQFAATLRDYRISTVVGDRYGGEWVGERFKEHSVAYAPSELVKSQIYLEALPLLNAGRVDLLDNARLVSQIASLERRTARGGKDSVDHPPGQHDDLCNAALGALTLVAGRSSGLAVWHKLAEHGAYAI